MKVYIKIINLTQSVNIYADEEENLLLVNGYSVPCDVVKFVGDVSLITFNWKESYYNEKILDGEEFRVKLVNNNNNERILTGKNSFPNNYGEFKKLLNEVAGLWN